MLTRAWCGQAWDSMLKGSGLATVDISGALAVVSAAKDEEEVKSTKRAAYLAAQVKRNTEIEACSSEALCLCGPAR